jgi:cell division protein FtsN
MARREPRPNNRDEPRRTGKKSGGLFLGLLLGLVVGLVAAAGLAWYFNLNTGEFKPVAQVPEFVPPVQPDARVELTGKPPVTPTPSEPAALPAPKKPAEMKPTEVKPTKPAAPIHERKPAPASEPPSRVPLTFYGILPGEKPAKPVEPPKPKEVWWLQVAALKNAADADRLKARLSLLGLEVFVQEVESAGQTLYRVRVGPYKRDEDAFADLDTLAANNYEPRLFKEPTKP